MRAESLRNTRQFNVVYKRGKSIVNKHVVMYFKKNGNRLNQVGFSVSKKVGKAVTRNRVKRLLKEAYRLSEDHIENGYDIIFVARVRLNKSSFSEVEQAVIKCLKKAQLYKEG